MVKIGLTGGIGSGKTAVSNFFSQLGIAVIDSDLIAHEITQNHSPLTEEIGKHFGENVVKNGVLNRSALSSIIFSDQKEKLWLEKLLHPRIIEKMLEAGKTATSPYCIFVIPLLIEGRYEDLVDRILVVDAPTELQIERIKMRNNKSEAQIRSMINAQSSREEKIAAAHDVILNDGSLEDLKKKVLFLHEKYLSISSLSS